MQFFLFDTEMAAPDIVSYDEFDCRAYISMYMSQNAPSTLGSGMLELWSAILAEGTYVSFTTYSAAGIPVTTIIQ